MLPAFTAKATTSSYLLNPRQSPRAALASAFARSLRIPAAVPCALGCALCCAPPSNEGLPSMPKSPFALKRNAVDCTGPLHTSHCWVVDTKMKEGPGPSARDPARRAPAPIRGQGTEKGSEESSLLISFDCGLCRGTVTA